MINPKIREKFKKLYKEKFNIDLSEEETTQIFGDFINLMKIILQPNSKTKNTKNYKDETDHYEII